MPRPPCSSAAPDRTGLPTLAWGQRCASHEGTTPLPGARFRLVPRPVSEPDVARAAPQANGVTKKEPKGGSKAAGDPRGGKVPRRGPATSTAQLPRPPAPREPGWGQSTAQLSASAASPPSLRVLCAPASPSRGYCHRDGHRGSGPELKAVFCGDFMPTNGNQQVRTRAAAACVGFSLSGPPKVN